MTGLPIRAVTFDYWNTIVRTRNDQGNWRLSEWRQVLAAAGCEVPDELIVAAFDAEWQAHHEAWQRNEQYTGDRAARGAIGRLGVELDVEVVEALVDSFASADADDGYELCPGVDTALRNLEREGVTIGIICDVGFTPSVALRRMLDGFGILDVFAGWSFSDEVGCYKPAAEIFEHALGYLGEAAEACAHIGDLRRTDVAGALAIGMRSVRYSGVNDDATDGPEAHVVVTDYAELLPALGI